MRKPRDYAAELKALDQRSRDLKERRVRQLGELVVATGADALDPEILAGGLLALAEPGDAARKESLRERGAGFFRKRARGAAAGAGGDGGGASPDDGSPAAG